MAVEIVTKQDLEIFKFELLGEIKSFLKEAQASAHKKWLRSSEVRKMLSISPGTLQNLRINGSLRFTKIGGTMFYRYEDIEKMLKS